MLTQCARLREQEIRWTEEIVSLTGRIESLNGDATPDQVRSLLTLRGRFLDQVDMLRETSGSLEERASSLVSVRRSEEAGEPAGGGSTVEEILDVEFEDLDQKLRSFADERDEALQRLAAVEAKYETETERREDLEGRLSAAENRIALGEERIREQEAAAAEARREQEDLAGKLGATEERLRAEVARREALEAELERTGEDRDRTLSLLAEAEARAVAAAKEFDEERTTLQAEIEAAKAACDRTEARRRDELRRLRDAVRGLTSRVDEEIRGFEDGA
jgi:chromosome segregation ATPase